jgi:His-Xaa-Ser system protein HxsD
MAICTSDGPMRLVTVDTSIYSLKAVLKSAYSFTARAYLHLQHRDATVIEVRMRPKCASEDPESIVFDFLNDLIDQRLRDLIAAETEQARDLILAHALSKTCLLAPELETADPRTDPLRVSLPTKSR